jgi:hypothetical protein
MSQRIGGILFIKVNGVQFKAKATNFEIIHGNNKKEGVAGIDGVHGYKETIVIPSISGAITDDIDLDMKALHGNEDVTVTAELANGKVCVLRNAWYSAQDEAVGSEEGEIPFKFEGKSLEEVK